MHKEDLIREIRKIYADKEEEKILAIIAKIRQGRISAEKLAIIETLLELRKEIPCPKN